MSLIGAGQRREERGQSGDPLAHGLMPSQQARARNAAKADKAAGGKSQLKVNAAATNILVRGLPRRSTKPGTASDDVGCYGPL